MRSYPYATHDLDTDVTIKLQNDRPTKLSPVFATVAAYQSDDVV